MGLRAAIKFRSNAAGFKPGQSAARAIVRSNHHIGAQVD